MKTTTLSKWILLSISLASGLTIAQSSHSRNPVGELRLHLVLPRSAKQGRVPAVAWLEPLKTNLFLRALPPGHATLLQKNRMFVPHLQVIPVGTVVQFPNADPFFHNVFSLFNGKRFDLGLYEAGSSKSVTFSREGVSYIFCNIHPEMSAVVLVLSTPLYALVDQKDDLVLPGIPDGDYTLHIWVEGVPQAVTDQLSRPIRLSGTNVDLGALIVPILTSGIEAHSNKFGNKYDPSAKSSYVP